MQTVNHSLKSRRHPARLFSSRGPLEHLYAIYFIHSTTAMTGDRTQVAIIGAGPAGLLLSHLLHMQGIESVLIELRSRSYVESRIRAGQLEWGTVELLKRAGLGARMLKEGLRHDGFTLVLDSQPHRIDLADLTQGKSVTIYGQSELVKDLIRTRLEAGGRILFGGHVHSIEGIDIGSPVIQFTHDGERRELACDYVAGCDGFHGICRPLLPQASTRVFAQEYPLAWLGILAQAPVFAKELVYSPHERGFSLFSMRTPMVSRAYLQCMPSEDLSAWPDERIWRELHVRLEANDGRILNDGPIMQKSITRMRSLVVDPMQHGRLFLAGDSAHIVPPSAAKGLNAAVADAAVLSRALGNFYRHGSAKALANYSKTCLKNVWEQQHFSWRMTRMLHHFSDHSPFDREMQRMELKRIVKSRTAAEEFAESYVGTPWLNSVLAD